MLALLDAPVPYIFGVPSLPDSFAKRRNDTLIVFIDNDYVRIPNDLYRLPEGDKFKRNLSSVYPKPGRARGYHHPSNSSRHQLVSSQQVVRTCREYIQEVSVSIYHSLYRQPGMVHIFEDGDGFERYKLQKRQAIRAFLKRVPFQNRRFVASFIQTQHFFFFIDWKQQQQQQQD
eukprot:CAMPEP_0201562466 /NCGR_PEP_ID=MMETSP0173_2-20130828/79344_1 /ASSEMBLY_ACC=CAM_ASM_000268 /TAXON_ID=218659 /ORGANISM="Vexillifera sp., Strain DIVA3 564/2" /LENGTH=173 /DNA_ID=CAMNT_0047977037 /DNA_START=1152 /DNA_END=1673 /DNA_ORIENTATION=-